MLNVDRKEVIAKTLGLFVGENVEIFVTSVDRLYVGNFLAIIQVKLILLFDIDIEAVLAGGKDKFSLICAKVSVAGVLVALVFNFVYNLIVLICRIARVIKSKNLLLREENEEAIIPAVEVELNACIGKGEPELLINGVLAIGILLVNHYVFNFLLVSNEALPQRHAYLLLAVRDNQVEYFRIFAASWHFPTLLLLEFNLICNYHLVLQSNYVRVAVVQVGADGALPVLVIQLDLEVVVVLSRVDHEARLVLPISNSEFLGWSEHHLRGSHEINHHVFKLGHQSLLINDVEVNPVFANNLNSNISLDEVDLAARVRQLVIQVPVWLLPALVIFLFEEKD